MATVTETSTEKANASQVPIGEDRWVEFPATWKIYNALCARRGEKSRPKYTFIDGRMLVVSPGHSHESFGSRVIALIQEIVVELAIHCHVAGSVTLKKTAKSRAGTEADATYYFRHFKSIQGKENLVMGVDPPPDLVVLLLPGAQTPASASPTVRRPSRSWMSPEAAGTSTTGMSGWPAVNLLARDSCRAAISA